MNPLHLRVGLVLFTCVFLVTAPRFDGVGLVRCLAGEAIPREALDFDQAQYIAMVEMYRGQTPSVDLRPAYSYRPLTPWLASLLPFRPSTALNVVNVLAIAVAAIFVLRTLRLFTSSARLAWAGALVFVFSFPVFWYGPIGYTDPLAVLVVAVGLDMLLRDRMLGFIVVLGLGALAKETTLVLLPVALARALLSPGRKRGITFVLLGAASFAVGSAIGRTLSPLEKTYAYWFGLRLSDNLWRPRAYLSLVLTLGIPGFVSLAALPALVRHRANRAAEWVPLVIGGAMCLLIFVAAMFIAYADGRFVWLSYPFLVPLAVYGLGVLQDTRRGRVETN